MCQLPSQWNQSGASKLRVLPTWGNEKKTRASSTTLNNTPVNLHSWSEHYPTFEFNSNTSNWSQREIKPHLGTFTAGAWPATHKRKWVQASLGGAGGGGGWREGLSGGSVGGGSGGGDQRRGRHRHGDSLQRWVGISGRRDCSCGRRERKGITTSSIPWATRIRWSWIQEALIISHSHSLVLSHLDCSLLGRR